MSLKRRPISTEAWKQNDGKSTDATYNAEAGLQIPFFPVVMPTIHRAPRAASRGCSSGEYRRGRGHPVSAELVQAKKSRPYRQISPNTSAQAASVAMRCVRREFLLLRCRRIRRVIPMLTAAAPIWMASTRHNALGWSAYTRRADIMLGNSGW
jgi:hypothetical protein